MLKESNYLATISRNSILYDLMIKFAGISHEAEKTAGYTKLKRSFDESKDCSSLSFKRCILNGRKYDSYSMHNKDCAIMYNDINHNKLQYALIDRFIQNNNKCTNSDIFFKFMT